MRYCQVCHRCFGDGVEYCLFDQTYTFLVEQLPTVIDGKYRLEQLIAHGGMGSVYRAIHQQLERPVAIKILRAEFLADRVIAERFNREARAAAKLKHPNIVAIYDFGSMPNGGAYLVMELIEGWSLREELRTHSAGHGQMRPERAVAILSQVCAGVEAAHRRGVIHRDLKPDNVMIEATAEASERVLVLDFGIAKLKDRDQGMKGITDENTVIGTPNYISPEQCTGQGVDARSDIYSLGVILYEMLTGRTPFASQDTSSVLLRHLQEPPAPPSRFRAGLSRELEYVVLRALAKNPSHRYSSAAQFAEHLYAAIRTSHRYMEGIREEVDATVETRARRPAPIVDDELTGFQPRPLMSDQFTGVQPRPVIDDQYAGYQQGPANDDQYAGYQQGPVNDDQYVGYQQGLANDDQYAGYQQGLANDDQYAGYQPEPITEDQFADVQAGTIIEDQFASVQPGTVFGRRSFDSPAPVEDVEVRPPTLLIERPPRTKLIAGVMVATLCLMGLFGYLWLNERQAEADEPAASSTSNLAVNQQGARPAEVSPDTASTDGKITQATSVKISSRTDSAPMSPREGAEREVRSVYADWVKAAGRKDWSKHLSYYADRVDYFRDGKLTREQIGARKRKTFGGLESYTLNFTKSPQIRLRQVGGAQEADLSFDKQWRIKRNRKVIKGEARNLITLRREERGWRIISEKQIRK